MESNLPPGWTLEQLERELFGEEPEEEIDENELYDMMREDRWDT